MKNARERIGHTGRLPGGGQLPGRRRDVRHDAQDVRRVVERHNAGGAVPPRRGRSYETVRGLVAEKVRNSQGWISAKRLLPKARAAGYAGSARNFRHLVAEVKAAAR